jgi:hypothetical protein
MSNDPSPQTPPPNNPPSGGLPAMNDSAAQKADSTSNGSVNCKPKTYFAVIVVKQDEKNQETSVADLTIDLNITGLGDVERLTAAGNQPVMIQNLEPGGKGDVVQMKHDTDVYEATGDFS